VPDVLASTSTTAAVTVGGTVSDVLEQIGDHDWFRVQLTAGQTVSIVLTGAGANALSDPYLYLRDARGAVLLENDDSGPGLGSRIVYTAATTGTFYIDVGAWKDGTYGSYELSVSPYTPPPIWTLDQIAGELVSGYWGGSSQRFSVPASGSLTFNMSALTSEGQFFASTALGLWSDITGIRFVEVASGGQIVFDDNQEGAFSSSNVVSGIITSSTINVDVNWISGDGRNLDSYSLQTYIHEVGHALGLGHTGDYNEEADYPVDALFINDSWSYSVMSYFSQHDNDYMKAQGFTYNYVLTPMAADVLAISRLYGLSSNTRTGNTTYGFNNNSGQAVFDSARYPNAAYTIVDSGGIDTLDYSGFSANQLINLAEEAFSNVGGSVGNVVIARGTVIENAIGGSGGDRLLGNGADNMLSGLGGNDVLIGGAGNDTLIGGLGTDNLTGGQGLDIFRDTASGLNGDTITDLAVRERIVISDAAMGNFAFSISGNVLTYTGGSVTLGQLPANHISARSNPGGGVQLVVDQTSAHSDFNGDGRDDVLWRNTQTGVVTLWLGRADGSFVNSATSHNAGNDWTIFGTGDFNGDGRDDILWRQSGTGIITNWLGKSDGSFVGNTAYFTAGTDWTTIGTGDFNGDGRDDILWRQRSTGNVGTWSGQADGTFTANTAYHVAGNDWTIAGTGDFNGDGRADILWQQQGSGVVASWMGQQDGRFVANTLRFEGGGPWTIVGTGDFNGDGRQDVLWRNRDGTVTDWLGQANGGFTSNAGLVQHAAGNNWSVVGTGDYNADGRDDILWRSDNGQVVDWFGQANGSFVASTNYHAITAPWQVQQDLWV